MVTGEIMVSTKLSLMEPPRPSLAVTRRGRLAGLPAGGVPLKVRVAGLKLSQAGSAVLLSRLAA